MMKSILMGVAAAASLSWCLSANADVLPRTNDHSHVKVQTYRLVSGSARASASATIGQIRTAAISASALAKSITATNRLSNLSVYVRFGEEKEAAFVQTQNGPASLARPMADSESVMSLIAGLHGYQDTGGVMPFGSTVKVGYTTLCPNSTPAQCKKVLEEIETAILNSESK